MSSLWAGTNCCVAYLWARYVSIGSWHQPPVCSHSFVMWAVPIVCDVCKFLHQPHALWGPLLSQPMTLCCGLWTTGITCSSLALFAKQKNQSHGVPLETLLVCCEMTWSGVSLQCVCMCVWDVTLGVSLQCVCMCVWDVTLVCYH